MTSAICTCGIRSLGDWPKTRKSARARVTVHFGLADTKTTTTKATDGALQINSTTKPITSI